MSNQNKKAPEAKAEGAPKGKEDSKAVNLEEGAKAAESTNEGNLEEGAKAAEANEGNLEEGAKEGDLNAGAGEANASVEAPHIFFVDDRGVSWQFKSSTPKTLNIDGVSMKLKDIIENKEIMLELVYGNCNFVEQK